MKIKFNREKLKEFAPYLAMGSITVGIAAFGCAYYLSDNFKNNIKQVNDNETQYDDLENSNGEIYYLFGAGEHKVKMSQNDAFYRNIEAVEGYEITDVEVNGWRDNSQVTFVNKVPVKVKATNIKDGKLRFDDFGVVVEEEKEKCR